MKKNKSKNNGINSAKLSLIEASGNYFLDVSKLVIGGVILIAILQMGFSTIWLFIGGSIAALLAYIAGMIALYISNYKK